MELLVIGVSGVTCGGKTTLASKLNEIFSNSIIISQDDYFLNIDDPRHTWIKDLNHINFDILSSLDMEKMHTDLKKMIKGKFLFKKKKEPQAMSNGFSKNNMQNLAIEKVKQRGIQIIIVEGFSIFNYKPMLHLFNLKYYFTLSKEECFKRRCDRVYEPPDCPGYFDLCVWPEHLKQLQEVQSEVNNITYINENTKNALEFVLDDILTYLS